VDEGRQSRHTLRNERVMERDRLVKYHVVTTFLLTKIASSFEFWGIPFKASGAPRGEGGGEGGREGGPCGVEGREGRAQPMRIDCTCL
jgi:hypothetical protein